MRNDGERQDGGARLELNGGVETVCGGVEIPHFLQYLAHVEPETNQVESVRTRSLLMDMKGLRLFQWKRNCFISLQAATPYKGGARQ